jgi:hypothetical protein
MVTDGFLRRLKTENLLAGYQEQCYEENARLPAFLQGISKMYKPVFNKSCGQGFALSAANQIN